MSGLQFTPGPWSSHRYLGTDENYFVRGPKDERVCGQGAGKVSEANANLIAASPQLFEALSLYVAACGNTAASVDRELVQEAWKRANTALAKAQGK